MLLKGEPQKTRADVVVHSTDCQFEQFELLVESGLAQDVQPGDVITDAGVIFKKGDESAHVVLEPAAKGDTRVLVHGIGVILNAQVIDKDAIELLKTDHVKFAY